MAMVAVPDRKQHGTFVLCRLVKNLIQARKRLLMKLIIFLLLQIGKRWHNFWTKYWKSGHSDLDSVSFVLYLRMPCRCFQHSFVQTILVQESSLFLFFEKKSFKKSVKMSWEENIASLKDQGLEHVAFYGIGSGWVVPSDGSNVSNLYHKIMIMQSLVPTYINKKKIFLHGLIT